MRARIEGIERIGVYGDGYTTRGRPNVRMNFALIDQSGQLFPYAPH